MNVEERITKLEERVQALEDVVGIQQLVATYGPAIDTDSRDLAAQLWTEDGVYDLNHRIYTGRAELRESFLGGPRHQFNLVQGCAHPSTTPWIRVTGDTAIAACYQHMIRREGEEFQVIRQNASVWHLVRTVDGWRTSKRVLRSTDGSGESSQLFRDALEGEDSKRES